MAVASSYMLATLLFLAHQHAGHLVGVGFDIGDGEFADMLLGEKIARLGDRGDQARGELAEPIDIASKLGARNLLIADGKFREGALDRA